MEFEERRKKERKEEGKEGKELQATPHATNAESMEHLPIRIFPLKEERPNALYSIRSICGCLSAISCCQMLNAASSTYVTENETNMSLTEGRRCTKYFPIQSPSVLFMSLVPHKTQNTKKNQYRRIAVSHTSRHTHTPSLV